MQTNCVLLGVASVALFIFAAGVAPAQAPGIELGVRLGYGIPVGAAVPDSDLKRNIAAEVPVWIDLGYRLNPQWMIGLYGLGLMTRDDKRLCESYHVDCSLHDLRLGAHAQYHVLAPARLDPWLGVGLGYEWLTADGASGGRFASATMRGWELANLQGGSERTATAVSFIYHTQCSPVRSGSEAGSGLIICSKDDVEKCATLIVRAAESNASVTDQVCQR